MANKEKPMLRGTPLQTLQCSTGLLKKGVEVDVPAGEAMLWASQKPPLFKLAKIVATAKK